MSRASERAEREAQARSILANRLGRGCPVYVLRTSGPRVLRLWVVNPGDCSLREITGHVAALLRLRRSRNGVSIPGGGSDPTFDTVSDLSCALGWGTYGLKRVEL